MAEILSSAKQWNESMWDIEYVELRNSEQIENDRQERIRLNKEFFASGTRFYDPNHKVHYSRFNQVDHIDGDVMYYKNGQIHVDYYIRSAKRLGLTVQQAREASQRGAISGSGKNRDNMVREFRDKNFGTNEQSIYAANRKLAAKVTASSYANMGSDERAYYDKMPNVFNFAKQASDEAGRLEDIVMELKRVEQEKNRIAEEQRVKVQLAIELAEMDRARELKLKNDEIERLQVIENLRINQEIYDEKVRQEKIESERLQQIKDYEEIRLAKELEKKVEQDNIKREESVKLKIIPEITPDITPTAVATSSLLPLGIIALFLYSRTGRK